MTERTYYVCLDDRGLVDSSILFIRKAVMDYLQSSVSARYVTVTS